MVHVEPEHIWMIVVGFIIAFVLAFGIGANDVANSFGTSVGARVLTLRQACILASIFETLGAILIGAKVSDTIRKGIIDIHPYINNTELLMVGNVAALSGSCVWLLAATLLRLPVSATHSIVGATIGFALVAHGARGINWGKLGMIIGSWFISPVLSGIVSTTLFYVCKYFIISRADPLEPGLRFLPVFYATTIAINLFSVFYDGPEMLEFDKIPLWGTFVIAFGVGTIVAIVVRTVVVPWQRRRIKANCQREAYTAPADKLANEDQVKFTFGGDNTNYSVNSSRDNSRDTSRDTSRKSSLEKSSLEMGLTSLEKEENKKNSADFIPEKKPAITDLSPVYEKSSLETTPERTKDLNKGAQNNKTSKGKISKAEDAGLLANEYNLGSTTPVGATTPVKSPTMEDLNKNKDVSLHNGLNKTLDVPKKITIKGASINSPSDNSLDVENGSVDLEGGRRSIQDRPETAQLFSFLQILTAIFGAFAHGGNDVSNAIGPLVSLWLVGTNGTISQKAMTPIWLLFFGGAGISIGLWLWGRRVIKTLGEDLTKITPSSGFCIEIGSALTVLVASNVGIPISTTHCKVGSVVFVGRFRSRENVDWSIFRNIVLAWLVTLPITGGISAAIMAGLRLTVQ